MSKSVINDYQSSGSHIVGSNNTLLVTVTGAIGGYDETAPVGTDNGTRNNTITINGTLQPAADRSIAIDMRSDDSRVAVGASGLVSGSIYVTGENVDITNAGHILGRSGNSGVEFSDSSTGSSLDNTGFIVGQYSAVNCISAVTIENESSGKLIGYQYGIELFTGGQTIINHGLIQGQSWGIWSKYGGDAKIVNNGTIKGGIQLGNGHDLVDTRGGTIVGDINLGTGPNTLITDNAKYHIADSGGENTVKSTVSYALNDNATTLILLGNKDTKATGSDNAAIDNYLYGNSGNNVLNGKSGYNELFGKGGTDTLIGNSGYDLFGIGKGYGHDTAKNYTHGQDQIDIYLLGPENYSQLKSHIAQHGNDTWIDFGKDILILKGVDHNVLDSSDFLFNY